MRVDGAKTAATAMIEAHARMYDAIHAFDKVDADGDGKAAEVGIVYPFSKIEAASASADDQKARADAKYFFEDLFMDGIAFGRVDENWDQGPGVPAPRADLQNRLDFVGVNYYFRFVASKLNLPISLSGVSPFITFDATKPFDGNYPQGIHDVLVDVAKRYGKPVYVSETGTTQDDEPRAAAWTVRTLSETRRAIRDGADVRGYYAWSLMDNYEWNSGTNMKFGLYQVDPITKERARRDSGRVFAEIAGSRDVSPALEATYASFFP
jgi:beta-galactosidase